MIETTVTEADLIRLGELVLNSISVMSQFGHVSPAQSTVYMDPGDEPMGKLFYDVLVTCLSGKDEAADARERICRFVEESGWNAKIALAVVR